MEKTRLPCSESKMPFELSQISATQLASLAPSRTVFFFPVGPLEDHGPHLPMGLDLHEAQELCKRAAERLEKEMPGWTGVLMPPAPLGIQSNTTALKITVRGYVLRDWLVDACRSLVASGFLHFVCFSGHLGPRQLSAIEDAGKIISRKSFLKKLFALSPGQHIPSPTLVSALSPLPALSEIKRAPFWPDPKEHGGARDTSVALAVVPNLVWPAPAEMPAILKPASFVSRTLQRFRHQLAGYWGSPSDGSAEKGNRYLQGPLDEIFPKLRAVWEGSNPNHLFRSWYSVLPFNGSFARAWTLVFLILAMLFAWIWVFIET